MTTAKSLYRGASLNTHALLGTTAIGMILTSIYLTQHYFNVVYSDSLAGSICDINEFFNCDASTTDSASNIFGIPISVFGIATGIITLLGYMFKDDESEGTIYNFLAINIIGCAILFIYSLAALGSLCPFCTMYYLFSLVAFLIFVKRSKLKTPSIKFIGIFILIYLIPAGIALSVVKGKENDKLALTKSLLEQFEKSPKFPEPKVVTPYKINVVENAPVTINVFSDFQCPACQSLSSQMHDLVKKYKDTVHINYYFYPLDQNCNPEIKRAFHDYACKAAYIASCLPEKFDEVHDYIFNNQESLSTEWLNNYAKQENVFDCMNKPETKLKVQELMGEAANYKVKSTPTMIVNGVKIEGMLPKTQMYLLLDGIIKSKK